MIIAPVDGPRKLMHLFSYYYSVYYLGSISNILLFIYFACMKYPSRAADESTNYIIIKGSAIVWNIANSYSLFTVLITHYCHLRLSHLLPIIIFGAYVLYIVNLVLVTITTARCRIISFLVRGSILTVHRTSYFIWLPSLHPSRDISFLKF